MTTGRLLALPRMAAWALAAVLAGGVGSAEAGARLLTDEDLDAVTAGGVQLDLRIDPNDQTMDFGFNFGNLLGTGSVGVGTTNPANPSMLNFTGPTSLNNNVFIVENMVFNLNLCVQCQAETIIQKGIGVPITFRGVTP